MSLCEAHWHNQFSAQRLKGEWFQLTTEQVTEFCHHLRFNPTIPKTKSEPRLILPKEPEMNSPVKEIREKLGFTQEKMAREMGCSYASARRFEYTGAVPRVEAVRERFYKLAKQAGIEVEA